MPKFATQRNLRQNLPIERTFSREIFLQREFSLFSIRNDATETEIFVYFFSTLRSIQYQHNLEKLHLIVLNFASVRCGAVKMRTRIVSVRV